MPKVFVGSVNQQLKKPFQKKKIIAAILALIAKAKSNNRLKDQPRFCSEKDFTIKMAATTFTTI